MDLDGKKVIYFYVPESTQGHSYKIAKVFSQMGIVEELGKWYENKA
jgi:hypothetical protein